MTRSKLEFEATTSLNEKFPHYSAAQRHDLWFNERPELGDRSPADLLWGSDNDVADLVAWVRSLT